MANKFEYDEKESKLTERAYLAPEVVRQRMHTLEVLNPKNGEYIVDLVCWHREFQDRLSRKETLKLKNPGATNGHERTPG
jgi:hypothetical protein